MRISYSAREFAGGIQRAQRRKARAQVCADFVGQSCGTALQISARTLAVLWSMNARVVRGVGGRMPRGAADAYIYICIYIYVMNIVLGVYLASILMLQQQTRSHLVPGKKQSDTGWVGKDMEMFDTTHEGDQT